MGNTVSQGTQGTQGTQQTENMPPQKKQIEKFTPVDDYRVFLNKNIKRYTANEPNIYLVNPTADSYITNRDNNQNFGSFKSVYGSEFPVYPDGYRGAKLIKPGTESKKQLASPLSRIFDFVNTATTVPPYITDGQNFCMKFNGLLDDSTHSNVETYYRESYLPSNSYRCGFLYNPNYKGQPVFRGHYAESLTDSTGKSKWVLQNMVDADILKDPNTEQYLNKDSNSPIWINYMSNVGALLAFEKYKCQMKAPACSNIESAAGCAWDLDLNRAVPISISQSLFDNDGHTWRAPPNYNAECPPPSVDINKKTNACTNANGIAKDGRIDRLCLISILQDAGCQDKGSLITALTTNPAKPYDIPNLPGTKYYSGLSNIFATSQTVRAASNIIGNIASNSSNSNYNASNWAARDLCLSNGALGTFDFCVENGPNTTSYELKCLQSEFRIQGGQITGKMYPTSANRAIYDALPNWSGVQTYITAMSNRTTSLDIDTQAKAFNDFYGINMQQFTRQYIPAIPNIEVFWFTIYSDKTISNYLGRRIQRDLTLNMSGVRQTGIQLISFFNLRPATSNTQVKFTFNNTDGIEVIKDQNITNNTSPNQGIIYAAWTDSTARNTGITNCWPLNANVNNPNYFTISWYNKNTSPVFTQTMFQTCDATPKMINSTGGPQMTMTQELDAPMLSFELVPDPTRNQIDYYSSDKIIGFTFGDARLRDVFPLTSFGGPTSNTTEKFGFSNRYTPGLTAGLQTLTTNRAFMYGCVQLNSGSYYASRANIDTGGWRTMTMLFKTGSLAEINTNEPRYIFQYNTISVAIKKSGTVNNFFINSGGIETTFNDNVLPNTVYYLIIIQDPTGSIGSYTEDTKLIVCVSKKDDLLRDPGKPFDKSLNGNQTYISGILPFTGGDYTFKIGGLNVNGVSQSVGMSVGWVRFFDYIFTTRTYDTAVNADDANNDDLTRDLYNTWKRNWWNMI